MFLWPLFLFIWAIMQASTGSSIMIIICLF